VILVDSPVWIDFFNGRDTRQTDLLDGLLREEPAHAVDPTEPIADAMTSAMQKRAQALPAM
jgi:hypothetical protein